MRKYAKKLKRVTYFVSYQYESNKGNGTGHYAFHLTNEYKIPKFEPKKVIEMLEKETGFNKVVLINWQEI